MRAYSIFFMLWLISFSLQFFISAPKDFTVLNLISFFFVGGLIGAAIEEKKRC